MNFNPNESGQTESIQINPVNPIYSNFQSDDSGLSESIRMIAKNLVSFGLIRIDRIHSYFKFGLILIDSD